MNQTQSLVLALPKRKEAAGAAEVRPKRVQAWLDGLPLTNATESVRQIYQALHALNRVTLDAHNRLEIMELYRRPLAFLFESLQSNFTGLALPLVARSKQLADFLETLQKEMAIGYKTAIHDVLTAGPATGKGRPVMPLALARAIEHLGRELLIAYQVYTPCPQGVWREIHQLYRYAEQNAVHATPLETHNADGETVQTTVTKAYQQVLLLGITNPYALLQGECRRVYAFLSHWPGQASITHEPTVADPAGHFLVNLNADGPPAPFPRASAPAGEDHLRILNAIEVVREVHMLMRRMERGETPKVLAHYVSCIDTSCVDLLRRLGRLWGMSIRRQSTRTPKREPVSICTGINATHHFVSGEQPFLPPDLDGESEPAASAATTQEYDVVDDQEDYIDLDNPPEAAEGESDLADRWKEGIAAPVLKPADIFRLETWQAKDEYEVYRWQTKDESAGGLALERRGEFKTRLRVGDVVGIRYGALHDWRVGVVRWLRSPETDFVEIGVQMLAPSARPVAVRRAPSAADNQPPFMRALLLPANDALRQPESLITPRGTYQPESALYLANGERIPRLVYPLQLLDRTGSFEHLLVAEGKPAQSPGD